MTFVTINYIPVYLSIHLTMLFQVLGKSVKPIPVMILGVLFAHKRYPLAKYFCVLLITIGVAMFIYKDSKRPDKGLDTDHSFSVGELLLVSVR